MAFQSGITTSANDLLDKIRLFATGVCGYTQLMYQADAGYFRLHLQHAASGQYVHLHSYASYVAWYGSTSFNSGLAYGSQTVASGSFSVSQLSGSAEYFLFGGDGWCYCIVQTASTTYGPLIFGAISKTCTFAGGAFLSDTYSTYVRADIDGNTNKWKVGTSGVDAVRAFYSATTRQLDSYSPIAFNGVTPLYPCTVEVGRPTPSYFYSMMGYLVTQSEGNIGPEAGVTYTVRFYNENNALQKTLTGLTTTAWTYLTADEATDSGLGRINGKFKVEIESVRAGYTSWQKQTRSVDRAGYGLNYGKYYGGI